MRQLKILVLLFAILPGFVHALGLGNLDLNSALNEPFSARIDLLSATAEELDSLTVGLADSVAFNRAGIERPFLLSQLKFTLRRSEDGPDYIRVFSQDPIREPFLNFLVEVSWSKGRLFREYTVLLDPPLYDPNQRAAEFVSETPAASEVMALDDPGHQVVYAEDFDSYTTAPVASPTIAYGGGDYGPTGSSDTLWSVAKAMRPDSSISINKMMLALLRANPEAFFNQNVNGLKRGQILRMPDESELSRLSNSEVLAEVNSQHALWGEIKGSISSGVSERPAVSSGAETSATDMETVTEAATEAELKLVTPTSAEGEGSDQATSEEATALQPADMGETSEDLVLARESIEALNQENTELKDRLQESEILIDDLKRLIALKDDELASLQNQIAKGQVMTEEALEEEVVEEEAVEEAAEEEMVEEEAIEEEVAEEEVAEEEVAEEEVAEEEAVEEEVAEEEAEDIVPAATGIMGMVNTYLGPVKDMIMGNLMIAMAAVGILIVLILAMVLMKFKKDSAEVVEIDTEVMSEFPDFDEDMGAAAEMDAEEKIPDSEAVTVIPETEEPAETEAPAMDEIADEDEGDKTQVVAPEAVAEEAEEEEDPLQEVNTYLAFEQFEQAEEFVRNAIEQSPDNPEYHVKLLEVFYTSGNKKSYEESAKGLHDLVSGEGEHWNMAVAMWSDMSPNRALFEEGADEEEDSTAESAGGGIVDITADDESEDQGLDFDIGAGEEEEAPAPDAEATDAGDEVLDITASDEGEDVLDVTAAVGLDEEEEIIEDPAISAGSEQEEEMLDITAGGDEELLDITADAGESFDDPLDVSHDAGGEDLLDVTAAADLDLDEEEDLLDVTAATSAGADSEELLEIEPEAISEEETDDGALEFDVAGVSDDSTEQSESEEESQDNVIDFDTAAGKDTEASDAGEDVELDLELDMGTVDTPEEDNASEDAIRLELDTEEEPSTDDEGEISLEMPETEEPAGDDIGLELNLGSEEEVSADTGEISLEMSEKEETADEGIELDLSDTGSDEEPAGDDIGLELDLGTEEEASAETESSDEISLDFDEGDTTDDAEMDFDISLDEDNTDASDANDIDLEGTVEMPKVEVDALLDDENDDEDEKTVFVPRSSAPEQQSAEDEIATKLDLAKAYVELGDKDSAKTILDEVIAEGNDEQKKQAEELLAQV